MSGEKMARVRLSQEAERQLSRDLEKCRENAAELAKAANLAGRAQQVAEEARRCLEKQEVSEGFRTRVERFGRAVQALEAERKQLTAMLDAAAQVRAPLASEADAARVADLRQETDERLRAAEPVLRELETRMAEVEAGLEAESRASAGREQLAETHDRRILAGIREEINTRLHPGSECNLVFAQERAIALRNRIGDLLARSSPLPAGSVESCRTELGELDRAAQQNEHDRQQQWSVFLRLDKALSAEFTRVTDAVMPQLDVPVRATHVARDAEIKTSIDSQVYRGGQVRILWRTPLEAVHVDLGSEQNCIGNLERIARMALDKGLIIDQVLWKGPDGWVALEVPGVQAGEDETGQNESVQRSMEAGE